MPSTQRSANKSASSSSASGCRVASPRRGVPPLSHRLRPPRPLDRPLNTLRQADRSCDPWMALASLGSVGFEARPTSRPRPRLASHPPLRHRPSTRRSHPRIGTATLAPLRRVHAPSGRRHSQSRIGVRAVAKDDPSGRSKSTRRSRLQERSRRNAACLRTWPPSRPASLPLPAERTRPSIASTRGGVCAAHEDAPRTTARKASSSSPGS